MYAWPKIVVNIVIQSISKYMLFNECLMPPEWIPTINDRLMYVTRMTHKILFKDHYISFMISVIRCLFVFVVAHLPIFPETQFLFILPFTYSSALSHLFRRQCFVK